MKGKKGEKSRGECIPKEKGYFGISDRSYQKV